MFRPVVTGFSPTPPFFATLVPTGGAPEDLKLGDEFGNGVMSYSLDIVGPFAGSANIIQRIMASRAVTGPHGGVASTTDGEFWVDGSMFYLEDGDGSGSILQHEPNSPAHLAFNDGPSLRLTHPIWNLDSASIVDYFKDYVVFRPDGDPENIYVTLGRVYWDWSATTTKLNEAAPRAAPTFVCEGPSDPDTSEEFPTWLETY